MVFSFIGSASLYVATVALAPPPNVVMAAFANGLTLGIVSAPPHCFDIATVCKHTTLQTDSSLAREQTSDI